MPDRGTPIADTEVEPSDRIGLAWFSETLYAVGLAA